MPERIQLSRVKGWRMPPNTVKVARPSLWGNPFKADVFGRELAVTLFRNTVRGCWVPTLFDDKPTHLLTSAFAIHCAWWPRYRVLSLPGELRGKNLACWCRPGELCHADVLLELANQP